MSSKSKQRVAQYRKSKKKEFYSNNDNSLKRDGTKYKYFRVMAFTEPNITDSMVADNYYSVTPQ